MPDADYRIMTDATGQRIATALEAQSIDKAAKADLTSIIATGTTNATGATIAKGTFFYLNGTLVQAKANIASGATFTSGTNYATVTNGGLNNLIKVKDIPVGAMSANTWYSYDYSNDADLKNATIISLLAAMYMANASGVFQIGLNISVKKIWYNSTIEVGYGNVIRVVYI